MNSSGIVTVIKPDFLLPAAFQQVLLKDCPHGFSYSVAEGNNTLESGFFDTTGEKPEEITKTLDEMNTKFKSKKLVLFFNRMEDPPELCQQPYPILTSKAGSLLINAFADGEFKKYEADAEYDPGTAFIMRYFGDELNKKYEACGKNLDKLFKELEREDYCKDLWSHLEPRGVIILHSVSGQVLAMSRSNAQAYAEFDWGFTTNALGYKEEKAVEDKEDTPPEGLNFMEKRKWLAEHKGKPAATKPKESQTTTKEVVPAKAADSSKSSVEKHPEGGTEVKLDPKLGILDGRMVRPAVGLQDRMLKDWYKVHDKDGCPQNFKQARPAIPFERLKIESSIRKFLEATGLFVTGVSAKDDGKRPTTGGLSPSQIASAVIVHKNATYIVDPLQFAASEKENPTFLQRLAITNGEFARMAIKDKIAILKIVGEEEFMRGINVYSAEIAPDVVKTKPVDTQTTDKSENKQPEPEKELNFMEKRKLAAQQRKTA